MLQFKLRINILTDKSFIKHVHNKYVIGSFIKHVQNKYIIIIHHKIASINFISYTSFKKSITSQIIKAHIYNNHINITFRFPSPLKPFSILLHLHSFWSISFKPPLGPKGFKYNQYPFLWIPFTICICNPNSLVHYYKLKNQVKYNFSKTSQKFPFPFQKLGRFFLYFKHT